MGETVTEAAERARLSARRHVGLSHAATTPHDGYANGDVLWLVHAVGAERTGIFR